MDNNKNEYEVPMQKEKVSKDSKDILKDVLNDEKASKKSDKNDSNKKKGFNGKKLKHGSLSVVFTCVFVAVLVLINAVATKLFEKYPITVDLTKEKIYSASQESEDYIKTIDKDVLVTIFAKEDTFENFSEYNKQALELLKNYCKLNDHISYRFVDFDSNPEVVRSYESVRSFEMVFETSAQVDGKEVKRSRTVSLLDLVNFSSEFQQQLSNSGATVETVAEQFNQQYKCDDDTSFIYYYGGNIESSNADQAYASALMAVTDPDPKYVTFLTGRNEISEFSYFKKLLTANGYNVDSADITSEDIPENTNIVVVPAPKNDYMDAEITKLSNFLNNNGNLGKQLIYIGSLSQGETPKLDEFLAEYGIKIGEGAVCETYQGNYYNAPYVTTTGEISDKFKENLQTKEPKIITALSRPVETLFDSRDMNTTQKYVQSSKDAYTSNLAISSSGISDGERLTEGQQVYMAVGSKAKFGSGDNDTVYSNLIAVGSEYMLSDEFLAYTQYQNGEYILSVVNGLTNKTSGITIAPKTVKGNLFDINELQKNVLKWTFCLIVPAAVLIVGIVIWVRRKNK